jgi:hypothetical protein
MTIEVQKALKAISDRIVALYGSEPGRQQITYPAGAAEEQGRLFLSIGLGDTPGMKVLLNQRGDPGVRFCLPIYDRRIPEKSSLALRWMTKTLPGFQAELKERVGSVIGDLETILKNLEA